VDVKNLRAILQLVEVVPTRISFSWCSGCEQLAQHLDDFGSVMVKVFNVRVLIQPQDHASSLSTVSAASILFNAKPAKLFQKT